MDNFGFLFLVGYAQTKKEFEGKGIFKTDDEIIRIFVERVFEFKNYQVEERICPCDKCNEYDDDFKTN